MGAFDRAWALLKGDEEEDEWPDRISNLLGGGDEELFDENYQAAKEGKTREEHDDFMMKVSELIDRLLNPPKTEEELLWEAAERRLAERARQREADPETMPPESVKWEMTNDGVQDYKEPKVDEEDDRI